MTRICHLQRSAAATPIPAPEILNELDTMASEAAAR
jgi:hypothetical protein